MLLSCAAFASAEDEITLDVIICQYGPNTHDWFLGKGMNGTNFVDKFEAENPGIKLNLDVVSWNDVYQEVSTRIENKRFPDILNIDVFADYAAEGLLMPVKRLLPRGAVQGLLPRLHRAVRDRRHRVGRARSGLCPRPVLQRGLADRSRR